MYKKLFIASIILIPVFAASRGIQGQGCNPNPTPFTDLGGMPSTFCQAVAQAYFSGLTFGTSPNTYSPSVVVTRDQMSAFITRTQDSVLKRGSRRALVKKWWTPMSEATFGLTTVGLGPLSVEFDGQDLWVANNTSGTVSRVRASDGRLLETWTGATNAAAILIAEGRIFVTGATTPFGRLYMINPAQPPGAVTTVVSSLEPMPVGIAFDGARIWTANQGAGGGAGSVSIITPIAWTVATATGFQEPHGIVFDGANMWLTDYGRSLLYKLDSNGNILQTINVGARPNYLAFDGTNLWVPIESFSVAVVRAVGPLAGTVLARPNTLSNAYAAAFDGERVLITHNAGSVTLFKAADITPLGVFGVIGGRITGACSDGINFWLAVNSTDKIARF